MLLSGPELLGLVLVPAGHDEGRVGGGDEAADALVLVEGRQHLGAVRVDDDLEAGLGDQEDVLGPGEAAVVEVGGDLGVVEAGDLEVDVPHVGGHADHVGHAQLVPRGEAAHDVTSLKQSQ